MITYACPRCQTKMASPDEMLGKREKCPACGTLTIVPRQRPPAPEPADAYNPFNPLGNLARRRVNPAEAYGAAGAFIGAVACLTLWYPVAYIPTTLLGAVALSAAAISYSASRRRRRSGSLALPFL